MPKKWCKCQTHEHPPDCPRKPTKEMEAPVSE